MRRRGFIRLVGTAVVTWPRLVHAQRSEPMRRIGVLMSLDESEPEGQAQLAGFTQGLADLGWIDGSSLRMEIRWGSGEVNRIQTFAKELVAMRPDVILAQGTPVTAALHRETRTIPIVFVTVTDPVGEGFVAGLPSPGGNITGFITSEAAMGSKLLALLMEIAPGMKRAAMLFNPDTAPGRGTYYLRDFEAAARKSKVVPIAAAAQNDIEIGTVITSLGASAGSGLIVMPDYFMLNHSRAIISLAAENNLPAIFPWRFLVARDGALISYGPDFRDIFRRAAPYVNRIFRGANPDDLPVQVPSRFEMAVNVKTAKALDLEVPTSILLAADEVIE